MECGILHNPMSYKRGDKHNGDYCRTPHNMQIPKHVICDTPSGFYMSIAVRAHLLWMHVKMVHYLLHPARADKLSWLPDHKKQFTIILRVVFIL